MFRVWGLENEEKNGRRKFFNDFSALQQTTVIIHEMSSTTTTTTTSGGGGNTNTNNAQPRKRDELRELSQTLKKYAGQSGSDASSKMRLEEERRLVFQR